MTHILSDDVIEHIILFIDWKNLELYSKMSNLSRSILRLFRDRYNSMINCRDHVYGLIKNTVQNTVTMTVTDNIINDCTLNRCDSYIDYYQWHFDSPLASCNKCIANIQNHFCANKINVSSNGFMLLIDLTYDDITIHTKLQHRHCIYKSDGRILAYLFSGCFLCNLVCEEHTHYLSCV